MELNERNFHYDELQADLTFRQQILEIQNLPKKNDKKVIVQYEKDAQFRHTVITFLSTLIYIIWVYFKCNRPFEFKKIKKVLNKNNLK